MNKKLFLMLVTTFATTYLWGFNSKPRPRTFNLTTALDKSRDAQKKTDYIIEKALSKERGKYQWQTSRNLRDALSKLTFRAYF